MAGFLRYKIYHGKFLGNAAVLATISLVFSVLACVAILGQRTGAVAKEAMREASLAEARLETASARIDFYMQRLYSGQMSEVFNDLMNFHGSDAEGYLTRRLESSKPNKPLASFPSDLASFFRGAGVIQVGVHNMKTANVITMSDDTGMSIQFGVLNASAAFSDGIESGFMHKRKFSKVSGQGEWLGEFSFLISRDAVFKELSGGQFGLLIMGDQGNAYTITPGLEIPEDLADLSRQVGEIKSGFFTRAVIYPSSHFPFKYVCIVDMGVVAKESVLFLVFITGAFFLAGACVLLVIASNLSREALFLSSILDKIESAKVGDFEPKPKPRKTGKNEYLIITEELEDMRLKLGQYIQTEYQLKLRQKEMEMKILQNQVNPHFLYNTLESIRSSALASGDSFTAEAIASLGALYRETVKSEDEITLGKELSLLKSYLRIMELKYPGLLQFQLDVPESMLGKKTVKLWMQPLAENFMKHGFNAESSFNLFIVRGVETPQAWILQMVDNGKTLPQSDLDRANSYFSSETPPSTGEIGLWNVSRRLRAFYGSALRMQIANNKEAGVRITARVRKGENRV
ncbi:MAG: histidine kinase [Clostridiales bacterium]|nr:histidine kinase [Clostridiales bacterium]MDR2752340.1 histidine kinase [Clostridiales bacterium]